MPKIIELTVELNVQKVSCPGVWLCQDGRVSLSIFALGTSYQTCLLPPIFPLMYKDVFYFRKRFEKTCALNNICCLLKNETIYCELVQWSEDCFTKNCVVLAQYLGALNDVLFPPNMCSNEGVDLLTRRTADFPGILSPKIEILTKIRIDEVIENTLEKEMRANVTSCSCAVEQENNRQRQVCHSSLYHRSKCQKGLMTSPVRRSRSQVKSEESKSSCSFPKESFCTRSSKKPTSRTRSRVPCEKSRSRSRSRSSRHQYDVYSVQVPDMNEMWCDVTNSNLSSDYASHTLEDSSKRNLNSRSELDLQTYINEDRIKRAVLESRYIQESDCKNETPDVPGSSRLTKLTPCVCEICRRYHELFHINS